MKSIEHYESLARAARAETCKHENAEHLRPGCAYDFRAPAHNQNVEQLRCLDCGAWLSLGRARDTPRVRTEIRAARIAQRPAWPAGEITIMDRPPGPGARVISRIVFPDPWTLLSGTERTGWSKHIGAMAGDTGKHATPTTTDQRVGWLVREIVKTLDGL